MATENIDIRINETGGAKAQAAVAGVGQAGQVASGQLGVFNQAVGQLTATLGTLGLALGTAKIIATADAYQELIERLKTVSKSSSDLIQQEQKLFDVAQRTRQSFEGTVSLYVGLKKASVDLNLSQTRLLGVVETINKALIVSRKTGDDVAGAMRRFSASLAQGTVDGRGLNTLMLQFPALAKAIAQGMGVSVGRLRELAQSGQITASQIITALEKSAPKVAEAFRKTEVTISEAFTVLGNAFTRTIGLMDQARGTTALLAQAIVVIAANMGTILPVLLAVTAGLTTFAFIAGGAAVGVGALFAVLRAHPFALIASILVIVIQLVSSFGSTFALTANGSITLLGALVGSFRFLVDAVQSLYTWITTTTEGMSTFLIAVATVTAALVLMNIGSVVTFLVNLATAAYSLAVAFGSLLVSIAPVAGAILAIVAAAALLYSLYKIITTGTIDLRAEFEKMRETLGGWRDSLVKSMEAASDSTKKQGLAAKDWGDTWKKQMDEVPGVVRFGSDKMQEALKKTGDAAHDSANAVTQSANQIRNAMGEMVSVTDEWAARSGALFNKVSQEAASMANSVASSFGSASGSASSFNPSSGSGSSGGGSGSSGGGSSGGTFSFGSFIPFQPEITTGDRYGPMTEAIAQLNNLLVPFGGPGGPGAVAQVREILGVNQALLDEIKFYRPDIAKLTGFRQGGEFVVGGNGGIDSQLVQLMATPGERVQIQTPAQQDVRRYNEQRTRPDSGRPIYVNMNVVTPDAGSFRRSDRQISMELLGKLQQAQRLLNG